MSQPEGFQLNRGYNPILTDLAQGMLSNLRVGYIADKLYPNIPVGVSTGQYVKWNRGDFMRRNAKKMIGNEAVPLGGFGSGSGTFKVDRFGLGTDWSSQNLADARRGGTSYAAFMRGKREFVITGPLLELEIVTATLTQTTGNWTKTAAGVSSGPTGTQFLQWDQAASDPVANMDTWKKLFRDTVGINPNTFVMSEEVYLASRKNANLIDRIKYSGTQERPTQVTVDQMKGLFEIDNVLIPQARYNSSNEGAADVLSPVWSQTCWLGYVAPNPTPDLPSAGYRFSWNGDTSMGVPDNATGIGPANFNSVLSPEGLFMRQFQLLRPNVEVMEAELFTTPNVVAADLGMTLTAVIA